MESREQTAGVNEMIVVLCLTFSFLPFDEHGDHD